MQRLKHAGHRTAREAATVAIEKMKKHKWYHIDEIRVNSVYRGNPRGMNRVQMSNYLLEQKRLGRMGYKKRIKTKYINYQGLSYRHTFYDSWWRRE